MTAKTFAPTAQPVAIPSVKCFRGLFSVGLILLLAIYFVGAEEGATSIVKGMYVHELSMTHATFSGSPATSC